MAARASGLVSMSREPIESVCLKDPLPVLPKKAKRQVRAGSVVYAAIYPWNHAGWLAGCNLGMRH